MTIKQLEAKQAMENAKYEAAKKIREILDALKKDVGSAAYEDGDYEAEIIELVTSED